MTFDRNGNPHIHSATVFNPFFLHPVKWLKQQRNGRNLWSFWHKLKITKSSFPPPSCSLSPFSAIFYHLFDPREKMLVDNDKSECHIMAQKQSSPTSLLCDYCQFVFKNFPISKSLFFLLSCQQTLLYCYILPFTYQNGKGPEEWSETFCNTTRIESISEKKKEKRILRIDGWFTRGKSIHVHHTTQPTQNTLCFLKIQKICANHCLGVIFRSFS